MIIRKGVRLLLCVGLFAGALPVQGMLQVKRSIFSIGSKASVVPFGVVLPSRSYAKKGLSDVPELRQITQEQAEYTFKVPVKSFTQFSPELASFKRSKVEHILLQKHGWQRLVCHSRDWSAVALLISKTLQEGYEVQVQGQVYSKRLVIGNEEVEVRYIRFGEEFRISDAWVRRK